MTTSTILGARIERISVERIPDTDPDLSYLTQDYSDSPPAEAAQMRAADAERLAAYGETWACEGVQAVAKVKVPTAQGGWIHTGDISSPGLWGIETDSDPDYFTEVGQEELAQLRDILVDGYRFPADEVDAAIRAYTSTT